MNAPNSPVISIEHISKTYELGKTQVVTAFCIAQHIQGFCIITLWNFENSKIVIFIFTKLLCFLELGFSFLIVLLPGSDNTEVIFNDTVIRGNALGFGQVIIGFRVIAFCNVCNSCIVQSFPVTRILFCCIIINGQLGSSIIGECSCIEKFFNFQLVRTADSEF